MSAIPATSGTENLYVSSSRERSKAAENARAADPDRVSHEDFLTLLTAQLTHQDPLNPIQDSDFISQVAQLQALDEQIRGTKAITALQRGSALAAGSSMIGRLVTGVDQDGTRAVGLVESVVVRDEEVRLQLGNGALLPLDGVSDMTYVDNGTDRLVSALQTGSALIGRVVTGRDANGQDVLGIVTRAAVRDGAVLLTLENGTELPLATVADVAELPMDADAFAAQLAAARDLVGTEVIGTDPEGVDREGTVHTVGLENGAIVLRLTSGRRVLLTSVPGALEA